MEVEGILNLRGCVCVYVTSWRPSQRECEYMRSSWSNRKGMVKVCVCVGGDDSSVVLCVMYHVPDCVAAAVTSKNKGVFMSSLTDLVFINVLPPFLSITISFHTSTPPSPHYISSKRCFGDHTDFFCICHKPFNIHTHARTHTCTDCAGFLHDSWLSGGLPEMCHVFSQIGWSAQADIHSHLTSSPPSHLHSGKG